MPLIPNPLTVAKTGYQVTSWLRRVLPRDHATIHRGMYAKPSAGRSEIVVAVACAPSNSLRRSHIVDANRALAFLNAVVPDGFAMPPSQSSGQSIGFQVSDIAPGSPSWDPVRTGLVWSNGLVELMVRPHTTTDDQGRFLVDLLSAARPIYELASAVRDGSYRRLYRWRSRARRVDWFIFLANYVSDQQGQGYWDDLIFPGAGTRHPGDQPLWGGSQPGLGFGAPSEPSPANRPADDPSSRARRPASGVGLARGKRGGHRGRADRTSQGRPTRSARTRG